MACDPQSIVDICPNVTAFFGVRYGPVINVLQQAADVVDSAVVLGDPDQDIILGDPGQDTMFGIP